MSSLSTSLARSLAVSSALMALSLGLSACGKDTKKDPSALPTFTDSELSADNQNVDTSAADLQSVGLGIEAIPVVIEGQTYHYSFGPLNNDRNYSNHDRIVALERYAQIREAHLMKYNHGWHQKNKDGKITRFQSLKKERVIELREQARAARAAIEQFKKSQ